MGNPSYMRIQGLIKSLWAKKWLNLRRRRGLKELTLGVRLGKPALEVGLRIREVN